MSLISRMRKQNAIYWPPGDINADGSRSFGRFVELVLDTDEGKNYRVRWQDVVEEFLDAQGETRTSMAKVFVPQLPNGTEVQVGGYLWLGVRDGLTDEDDPTNNEHAYEVRRVDKMPNFKASEFLRTVML